MINIKQYKQQQIMRLDWNMFHRQLNHDETRRVHHLQFSVFFLFVFLFFCINLRFTKIHLILNIRDTSVCFNSLHSIMPPNVSKGPWSRHFSPPNAQVKLMWCSHYSLASNILVFSTARDWVILVIYLCSKLLTPFLIEH